MIQADRVRSLALGLPEALEIDHWGDPSYRVRGKIFAVLHAREHHAVLKLAREDQNALVAAAPEVFQTTPWGHQGWTRVELRKVDAREFRALLEDAWRQVAPKRVAAAFTRGPRAPRKEKQ